MQNVPPAGAAADGVIHRHPVVFSHDSKLFFVAAGRVVRIHSTAHGAGSTPLGALEGHEAEITGLALNPANRFQLFTSSIDGTVRLWDYTEATCLATWPVMCERDDPDAPSGVVPVVKMLVAPQPEQTGDEEDDQSHGDFSLVLSVKWTDRKKKKKKKMEVETKDKGAVDRERWMVGVFNTWIGKTDGRWQSLLMVPTAAHHLATDNYHLVVSYGRSLKLRPLYGKDDHDEEDDEDDVDDNENRMDEEKGKRKKKGMGGWIKRSMITKVTAMAVHPYHPYIATGNNKGRITIWYNVTGKDFATSSLHWHAHPVHAIAFSSDGSYMFSGGEEAVLVIWQLETKAKQFLPRLGSVIRSITISPDGNIYALALADNSLKFVDAVSNSESLHVKGLALAHSLPGEREQHGVGGVRETLKTDPRDSLIACRGVPGRLQFYDALWEGPGGARGRHANELHVTLRAMVSRTERVRTRQRVLTSAYRVDAFEFDHTGQWLATVESSTLELTSCDYKLKFWRRPPSSPNFILTSTVRDPHGSSRVLKLTFKPPSDHASGSLETMAPPPLCTLGADNKFKFWHGKWRAEGLSANPRNLDRKQQEREQSGEGDGVFEFSCKAQGDFKTSHKANTMAFSQDGTVMAIGYSQIVTLWDTETFTLAHVLSHGGPMERIRSMVFVSRYLISATSTRLLVWDTVSLTTVFSHNLNVISLAVSPAAGTVTSTGPRFVALIGSLHPKPRQPTKIGKQNNSKTIGSCAAVVEFDARDGSPLRTCLITDVRNQGGMCFVTPRGRGSKDGNKGKGGGVLWPVLVYINDLFELKTIEGFGGSSDETVGMPASEAELQENESETPLEHSLAATSAQPTSTIFSQIYGGSASSLVKEVEGRPVTNGVPSMDLEGESEKEERVKRLLDVPSHMLMRVHTLFTSFMQAVLPTRAKSMASGKIENQPLQRANRAGQENGNETESEKKLEGKDEAEKECRRVDALLSHNLDQELEWNADAYLRMLEDVHDQDSSKKEVKDARSNKINSPKKRKGSAGSQKSSSKKKSKKRKSK